MTMIKLARNEKGFTLIEVLVALALTGLIAAAFLMAIATSLKAISIADERTTAESLARSQMEYVKDPGLAYAPEATNYGLNPDLTIPTGYSVTTSAQPINTPDDGIQKITVNIYHPDTDPDPVLTLESYKVDR